MRVKFNKHFHALYKLFWCLLFFLLSANALARTFEYIYIDASEGNASGGHTALRFGEDVFHYQYFDDGFIRVVKQQADDFEFAYRFLNNRSLYLSQIEVSDQTYAMLRDYFIFQTHIQKQQFSLLDSFRKDRLLLNWLRHIDDIPQNTAYGPFFLAGAGLFYASDDFDSFDQTNITLRQRSKVIEDLQKTIEMHYGEDFLALRTQQITSQIKQLSPAAWNETNLLLTEGHFPTSVYPFSDRYLDLSTGLLALKMLQDARELEADAYVIPSQAMFELTEEEIETLHLFSKKLQKSLLQLLKSNRPDWGYAVLVNSARLIAVNKSIQSGRLVMLDVFAPGTDVIDQEKINKYAEELRILTDQALTEFQNNRKALQNKQNFSERDYSFLEMTANRYLELIRGVDYKTAIRFGGENLLPTKSIALPRLVIPEIYEPEIGQELRRIDVNEKLVHANLKRLYGYNLITRNCVTELFRAMETAITQDQVSDTKETVSKALIKAESVKRLGGFVDSGVIGFIPFVSFHSVQNQYNVTASRKLASFRLKQLEQLYSQENDLLVSLRETNTISSRLYKQNPEDSFFIFFTDDTWLLRPLFGAVNTLAGVGETMVGLLSLPFDAGKTFKSGTMGVLMSLPELAFFNMRKGSYQYLSYDQLLAANELRD